MTELVVEADSSNAKREGSAIISLFFVSQAIEIMNSLPIRKFR